MILEITNANYDEITENPQKYRDLITKHLAIVFKDANFTVEQHERICSRINLDPWDQELPHFCWQRMRHDEEKPTGPGTIYDKIGWHHDHAGNRLVPKHVSINMLTNKCKKGVGDTYFIDLEKLYDLVPPSLKYLADTFRLTHPEWPFDPEAEYNSEDHQKHPLSIYHEDSKRNGLFISDTLAPLVYLLKNDDLTVFYGWLELELDKKDFLVYQWTEGDMVIFDNHRLWHGIHGGWTYGERVFDRITFGHQRLGTKPPDGKEIN